MEKRNEVITRAVYRPAYQDVTLYTDKHPDGVTYNVDCRDSAVALLRDFYNSSIELEEQSNTAYGLLKSIGNWGGSQ